MEFVLGIGISVFGSVASNFGVNVQKYSQIKNKELPKDERKPYMMQTKWWLGLLFVIMGALCDFGSLSFAPQSVVMPVGSLTLVANVFFAHFWLGEELGFTDIIGTTFIVAGAVIIAVAYGALGEGVGDEIFYDAGDLQELFHRWVILGYGVTVLTILAFFLFILKRSEDLVTSGKSKSPEYENFYKKLHPLSYAAVAGIFGSFSVTFGKAIGELLAATASDEKGDQFVEPLFYVFLISMVSTILLQTHFLAHGLEFFDALFIVPVFQCFFIILSIMGGALYWEEMKSFNAAQWAIFPLGVLVTLYGVYLMSSRDMVIEAEDEENMVKSDVTKVEDGEKEKDEHPLRKIIRPRLASTNPRLAKAIMPFTLLDNPVLKDPDQDGIANNSYRNVTGSKRQIARKSRMVSTTGAFIPIFMDHETGDISKANGIGILRFRLPAIRIRRVHHPALSTFNRRATMGASSSPSIESAARKASDEIQLSQILKSGSGASASNTSSPVPSKHRGSHGPGYLNDLSRMHSTSMPTFNSTAFLDFAEGEDEEEKKKKNDGLPSDRA